MARRKKDQETEFEPTPEEGPEEPADDTEEAQPSIEREGAPGGNTTIGAGGVRESGGLGSAGNE